MEARPGVRDRLVGPRVTEGDGRIVVRYALAVVLGWIGLAAAGVVYGFVSTGADQAQGGVIGFALAAICTFVASFAVRPVVVADRTGIEVLPVFGTRQAFRWSEVEAAGVRTSRRSRGRGLSLELRLTDDREVKVDGLWMGLGERSLRRIDDAVAGFAVGLGVAAAIAPLHDDADE
jgi:hypothetical protein